MNIKPFICDPDILRDLTPEKLRALLDEGRELRIAFEKDTAEMRRPSPGMLSVRVK